MAMALKNRQDLARRFEDGPDGGRVPDVIGSGAVELLMDEDNGASGTGGKRLPEPGDLLRRDIAVVPAEIAAVVRRAVGLEVRIQDDEADAGPVEGIDSSGRGRSPCSR